MDPQPAAAPGGATTPSGAGSSSDPAARRHRISAAIAARRLAQHELISSLQTLVPDLVSSLDLSLRLISAFNHRPLETLTLAPPPRIPSPVSSPRRRPLETLTLTPTPPRSRPRLSPPPSPSGGAAAALVRTMIAVCLLELVPFTEIDSAALLRRLEGEQSSASPAELAALADLSLPLGPVHAVETALRRIAEETGGVQLEEFAVNGASLLMVWGIDRSKLLKELPETPLEPEPEPDRPPRPDSRLPTPVRVVSRGMGMVGGVQRGMGMPPPLHRPMMGNAGAMGAPSMPEKPRTEEDEMKDIEEMINKKTFKEMQKSKTGEELLDLIHRPTAKETANAAKFKTKGGSQVKEYCHLLTKEDCRRHFSSYLACEKVHFRRIIAAHTDKDLGDCSFLDTCRHTKTFKYDHYDLDPTPDISPTMMGTNQPPKPVKALRAEYCSEVELGEAQWVNCDIRSFRMDILAQFGVIMANPPWDIHMELPYGTMADDEMRTLNVPAL